MRFMGSSSPEERVLPCIFDGQRLPALHNVAAVRIRPGSPTGARERFHEVTEPAKSC